jgi:hypothetical protein
MARYDYLDYILAPVFLVYYFFSVFYNYSRVNPLSM